MLLSWLLHTCGTAANRCTVLCSRAVAVEGRPAWRSKLRRCASRTRSIAPLSSASSSRSWLLWLKSTLSVCPSLKARTQRNRLLECTVAPSLHFLCLDCQKEFGDSPIVRGEAGALGLLCRLESYRPTGRNQKHYRISIGLKEFFSSVKLRSCAYHVLYLRSILIESPLRFLSLYIHIPCAGIVWHSKATERRNRCTYLVLVDTLYLSF